MIPPPLIAEIHPDQDGVLKCSVHEDELWCADIKEYVKTGRDAEDIAPGDQIDVPIFPGFDIFADVLISAETIGPAASMTMLYMPDYGNLIEVKLGFWNKGEGRWSIRSVIIDWLMAQLPKEDSESTGHLIHTKCPSIQTHGIPEQKKLAGNTSPGWKWACLWSIVMEKACLPCVEGSTPDPTQNGLADITPQRSGGPWQPSQGGIVTASGGGIGGGGGSSYSSGGGVTSHISIPRGTK